MAKLIAANYNSTTSTAYGFMSVNIPAGVIKKNTVYTLVARYKWTKGSVDDCPMVAYFYDSGWTGIAGYQHITYTNDTYAVQTKVFTTADNDAIATSSFKIHNYACTASNIDKGAVLSVDWYELWEGDVTQFSLTDAIGLSGAGVNLRSNGRYPNSLTSGGTNGGTTTIDTSKFGYSVIKCVASAPNHQFYFWPDNGLEIGKTYLASVDVYTDDDVTSCNINIERSTIHGYYRTIGKNSWSRVWVLGTKTEAGGAITLYGPAGTFYYKNIKVCEAPVTALHSSVWTPSASELNEYIGFTNTDFTTSFKTLQNNCKNNNYFTDSTNGKTSLRNWMGYYSSLGYGFTTSLSTTSVAASGGTITVNYTVKENWTNGKTPTPKAGVTPTITSSIGTVSNITATDANGNGTAKITVASRGTTVGAAQTGTVNVSFGGVTKTATCTQEANAITSYGAITVTSHGSVSGDIPASGGSKTASGGTGTQTITYTSKDTRTGSVTCSTYSTVSADSLGTTVKARTKIGNSTATLTGEGGKTASVSVPVYQEANAVTKVTAVLKDTAVSSAHFTYGAYNSGRAIPATGVNNLAVVDNGAAILTFTSGAESDKLTAGNHYGGTLSFSRVFYFNGNPNTLSSDGFTINKTTGALTVTSNPTASARTIYAYGDLTATWGSLSHAITHQRNLKQNAGPVGQKQERTMFYRNPSTSLPTVGIQGGFAFQAGANTSFSSSTYTLPTSHSAEDQYMGITLTETDSTKASSFYIYMNNISVAVNSSIQPSVRMHLRVGVKSSATTFTETWYDQYITPTSIVNQNGMWIATWDSSKYALINIPASTGSGTLCHIDVEFTY